MATRRFKISVGETYEDVTEEAGAAVNSDDVELTIELATSSVTNIGGTRAVTKQEVLDCIEQIKLKIIHSSAAFDQ